uniref:Uncharacterized protein n=1 Tax=Arundo donax TaxID=35708 RepID=A0A0A8Y1C3_ARUDO
MTFLEVCGLVTSHHCETVWFGVHVCG